MTDIDERDVAALLGIAPHRMGKPEKDTGGPERPATPIVAVVRCANGNETVGTQWLTTGIFRDDTPMHVIMAWAEEVSHQQGGNVEITVPTHTCTL